ncbi:MAG: response regulator [Gammaproteobacteria bacterium]|nr:response regulator [Gammaproteobacteria bacterium]
MTAGDTILIVDDEPLMRDIFSEILSDCSYRILTAGNGLEALEVLKREAVDLLLSDVIMPEVDGYELAAQVCQLYPKTKVQLISGFSDNGNQKLVPAEIHEQLMPKPIDPNALIERINSLLN